MIYIPIWTQAILRGRELDMNLSEDTKWMFQQQRNLKQKVSCATYWLKVQQIKLENVVTKMQQHDMELFNECVSAQMAKDAARATIYANECAKVRKMAAKVLKSQLALEQLSLRLEMIPGFGSHQAIEERTQ